MMNCETGFRIPRCLVGAGRSVEDPRGARHWGRIFVSQTCIRQDRGILTMMRSCASAAKLRAAGPFYRSASSARFEYGVPPPRIVNSAVVLKSQPRAPNSAECYARSGKPFQDAGRKTTPSNGSPVVTKRQSAMISLRASATIMVLRVPLRLSAVRARYHNVSALSF
jgi:hypothetical protein